MKKIIMLAMLVGFFISKDCFSQDSIRLDQFSLENHTVKVPDKLLFHKRTATISPNGQRLINQFQQFCDAHPNYHIAIEKSYAKHRRGRRLNRRKMQAIMERFKTDTNYLRNNNVIFFPVHSSIELRKSCAHCTIFSIVMIKPDNG